jgi:hypothetical protein
LVTSFTSRICSLSFLLSLIESFVHT